ncbi:HMA2 domain-containing protein [Thioalkalicoccus limnaeus]|uniref:HMA2 domain-containing protein n=1 Tax=Thioalkalicoccus limnaeus TaxID=120681 RepID=A0ABV4BI45_9GAMM
MSHYIHHIPGRLRVRSNSFRCRTAAAQTAHDQLMAMDGVSHVRLNPRAGSITVQYDPDLVTRSQLLAVLEDAGCAGVMARGADASSQVGQLFGKALVGAIVNKAVERSAVKLVSVLL